MTNETNKTNIQQNENELKKKTTTAVGNTLLGKIMGIKAAQKHNLLIDVSGSMTESVHEEGKSRYETTTKRAILEDLLTKIPAGITKYAFSHSVKEFTGALPFEGAGTRMDYAFEQMKAFGKLEIVLITDGMPDDEHRALKASKGLKVDIIYIGPQPQPEFLEKLAGMSGGSFTNINLIKAGATQLLKQKVTLLLGA